MEICRVDPEAKDRNCSRTPVRTPPLPPFSPHPNENKNVRGKTPRITLRNKRITSSQVSRPSKRQSNCGESTVTESRSCNLQVYAVSGQASDSRETVKSSIKA